jgi:hypothetical protein
MCWRCQELFQTETIMSASRGTPVEGDVVICVGCGALSVYERGGVKVRRPNPLEEADLISDPDVVSAARAAHAEWARRTGQRPLPGMGAL